MSVSEKLKALDGGRWKDEVALCRALPQIVALVESVESDHPEPHHYGKFGEGGEVVAWECPVCSALSDLDLRLGQS